MCTFLVGANNVLGSPHSEEVFDYSAEEMTQDKIREMKASLNREIGQIFELCFFVVVRTALGSAMPTPM